MDNPATGGLIAGGAMALAALVAGWWQWRIAKRTVVPDATTAIGTEYQRLVATLQGEVDRVRGELETLRRDCEQRDAAAQARITHLEHQVTQLEGEQP